jgi:nicotinate-nucleotide adenylyltransferase
MVELASAADPRFEASRLEEGAETSYTIHTIERVRTAADGPLFLLIGADAFADIRSWFRWEDVVRAVTFIVVSRPGAAFDTPPGGRVLRLEGLDLPESSSEIRRLIKGGLIEKGRGDLPVPPSVQRYILDHHLYS